jgi:hypothetical protein
VIIEARLTAYIVVTLLAAAANIFSATLDFIHYKQILINMQGGRVGIVANDTRHSTRSARL